jgi:hypothetical protein
MTSHSSAATSRTKVSTRRLESTARVCLRGDTHPALKLRIAARRQQNSAEPHDAAAPAPAPSSSAPTPNVVATQNHDAVLSHVASPAGARAPCIPQAVFCNHAIMRLQRSMLAPCLNCCSASLATFPGQLMRASPPTTACCPPYTSSFPKPPLCSDGTLHPLPQLATAACRKSQCHLHMKVQRLPCAPLHTVLDCLRVLLLFAVATSCQ